VGLRIYFKELKVAQENSIYQHKFVNTMLTLKA